MKDFFNTSLGSLKKVYYSLDDFICFQLYYNYRLHSTTKVTPYKAIMDANNKQLMGKINKNTLKRRLKAKTITETHSDNSNIRISNYVKIIDKQNVSFDPPRRL